jgi:hypothetical protein
VVRVSFAVRPPDDVVAVLAAVPRRPVEHVTWTVPQRWIIKLRPLGHVPVALYDGLMDAVASELDGAPPIRVGFGPTVRRYGGQQLSVPVSGLDELSEIIFAATEPLVPVTHPQPFHADVVLANGRIPADLAGTDVPAEWVVTGVSLVADRSSPRAVRLADVASILFSD